MFNSRKSTVTAILIIGLVLTTIGAFLYNRTAPETQETPLSSYLPSASSEILLPPPANIFVRTAPEETIPGIRRLKLVRPALSNAEGNEQSEDDTRDYYLTGTRSAELIREPVEAHIETFPSVTLEEAVEGALSVDEWGFLVM